MDILFHTDDCNYRLPQKRLMRRWLREVAQQEGGYEIAEINYVFCSAERHRAMNIEFLGHDYFTDIITFDDSDLKEGYIAGDVFIDIETVRDNARLYGATARQEMLRVIVHGVLHLCGQKDKTPRAEKQMHKKEDKYLALLEQIKTENGKGKTNKILTISFFSEIREYREFSDAILPIVVKFSTLFIDDNRPLTSHHNNW